MPKKKAKSKAQKAREANTKAQNIKARKAARLANQGKAPGWKAAKPKGQKKKQARSSYGGMRKR